MLGLAVLAQSLRSVKMPEGKEEVRDFAGLSPSGSLKPLYINCKQQSVFGLLTLDYELSLQLLRHLQDLFF